MIILPAVLLGSCAQNESPASSTELETTVSSQIPESYTTYNDPDFLFTISFPHTWKNVSLLESVVESGRESIDKIKSGQPFSKKMVFAVGPRSLFTSDYFPDLSVSIDYIDSEDSLLEQHLASTVDYMSEYFEVYEEISRTELSIDDHEAVMLEFEAIVVDQDFHNYRLIVIRDNLAWEIDIMCRKADFSRWEQDFKIILESFSFLE